MILGRDIWRRLEQLLCVHTDTPGFCFDALLFSWMLSLIAQLHTGNPITMPQTSLLSYIFAFFFSVRTARAGDLHRMLAAKPASTFAWTCVSRSFVERRTSGLHYLTSDMSTKAICSVAYLPYITIWMEQADLDGAIRATSRWC